MAMDRLFYSKKDRENVAVHRVLCMYNNLAYIYSRVCVPMRRTTILNSKRAGDMAKVSFSIWLKVSSMLLKHGGNVESRSWFVIKNWSIHRMESASIFFFFFFFSSILYLYHCCLCIVYRVSMMEYRVCLLYPDAFFLFYSSFRVTSAMLHFDACRSFIIEREIFVKFVEFKNFFFPP